MHLLVCFSTAEKNTENDTEVKVRPTRVYKFKNGFKSLQELPTMHNTFDRVSDNSETYFEIKAFEKRYIFNISADYGLLSPKFEVENFDNHSSKVPIYYRSQLHNCFFSGEVVGYQDSAVVFNMCNGLVGIYC